MQDRVHRDYIARTFAVEVLGGFAFRNQPQYLHFYQPKVEREEAKVFSLGLPGWPWGSRGAGQSFPKMRRYWTPSQILS
jgi:hypothetical protein